MAREQSSEVRAVRDHIQPGTFHYRVKGERFSHTGKLYKHVEPVKTEPVKVEQPAVEPQGDDSDLTE